MTPFEWTCVSEAFYQRLEARQKDLLSQAWLTAAWQRSQRMPSLAAALTPAPKPVALSDAEAARQQTLMDRVAERMRNKKTKAQEKNEAMRAQKQNRKKRGR